jgi:transcriptional regulator with XRE-family HTH domain
MSASKANPTVRRWELAAALRALRLEAGLSIEDVAAELMCSAAKVSRLETAGRGIQPRDVRDLCRLYKVNTAERDRLMALATAARQPTWWHGLPLLDSVTTSYLDLEAAASSLRAAEGQRIHGLLQTEAYTRYVLRNIQPPELAYDDAFIDQTVEARKHRQLIAQTAATDFTFVIDEAAVRRPLGSPRDTTQQIERLLEVSDYPNHEIRIIPFAHGMHPGIHGTFVHMRFPQQTLPDAVLVEGHLGLFVIDKEAETIRYGQIFEQLLAVALDEKASQDFLRATQAD